MVSNSQSLDLFSVTPKSLVWESVFLQTDTDVILEDQMRIVSLQLSGSRSFEYLYVFPLQLREPLCLVYFYERKNPYITQFLFRSHNKQVLRFFITAVIMKEGFLIFKSILAIYQILFTSLP